MIDNLRKLLQSELKAVEGLTSGKARPDDIIEEDEVYFGYELTTSVNDYGLEYQFSDLSVTLTGRLVSKNKSLSIMDEYSQKIAEILKKLRFKYTIQDVTQYDKINKMIINGRTSLNEVNNNLR